MPEKFEFQNFKESLEKKGTLEIEKKRDMITDKQRTESKKREKILKGYQRIVAEELKKKSH